VVTITINTCDECHHLSSSGAFTKGGAKPICGNSDSCESRKVKDKYDWRNRVLKTSKNTDKLVMPDWCPLKQAEDLSRGLH